MLIREGGGGAGGGGGGTGRGRGRPSGRGFPGLKEEKEMYTQSNRKTETATLHVASSPMNVS